MDERQITGNHLVLLVGSNPLPNYLAALILKPKSCEFFYSPETEEVKNCLKRSLKARLRDLSSEDRAIEDATNAAKVRDASLTIPTGSHLHYTGGTKIMAAHARMAFRERCGNDQQASYLDERKGVLRFDDGYEIDLSEQRLELTIDDIFGIHGIERTGKDTNIDPKPYAQDAQKIAIAVLDEPELANELYNIHREEDGIRKFSKAKQNPEPLHKFKLSIARLPDDGWTRKVYEEWCKFLGGGWLEVWCADLVRGLPNGTEVSAGINCERANGRKFEIDVAMVRGHRLFVVSCTTDTGIGLCKSKLFEVAMRARQMGGDLARSALVCLLHGSNDKGAFVDQLRKDVAGIWDAPNTPRIFGQDDLKEWAGRHAEPNTRSLEEWLDS